MTKPEMPRTAGKAVPSLADLERAVQSVERLSSNRRRDLRSAVTCVAALLGDNPAHLPLVLEDIAGRLGAVNPVAAGMSAKRFANIRSDFLAAVRASGLQPVLPMANTELAAAWGEMLLTMKAKRYRLGLARLARYCSAVGVEPVDVDDAIIERFIDEVRRASLHQKPNVLHRSVATIWNEAVAMFPSLGLAPVTKPSFRPPPKRIVWEVLGQAFRGDVEAYLEWCAGLDPFAEDARPRKLSPRTLKLRRNQIHAAASALVESGVPVTSITTLSDLTTIDHFRAILRGRNAKAEGKPNNFNRDLAEALVQIAREWVKLDSVPLGKLNMLAGKMPMQRTGLTFKNKRSLAQFDDPKVVARLLQLPGQLWMEVKREQKPNFRTLAKAQAALAIAMSTYMPVRSKNLHELTFDIHLFLRDGVRATCTMEFGSDEVKNRETELAFDIPAQIGRMLIEYRDRIAPKVIGHRPERVFVKADGSPKSQAMVAVLIATYLTKRAGIIMTPHQFRHLSAKMILDAQPGAYETVRQLLGQKNLKTTVNFYAGLDSRRAGQHHQRLLDQALASRPSMKKTKAKKPSGGNGAG